MLPELTAKEHRITQCLVEGMTNQEIAIKVGNTYYTVKDKLKTVFDKTGMSSRLELALWYLHHFEMK